MLGRTNEFKFDHYAIWGVKITQFDQMKHWFKECGESVGVALTQHVDENGEDGEFVMLIVPNMTNEEVEQQCVDLYRAGMH